MTSALILIAIAAGCGLMLWAAFRMEPHWVSKDAQRLVCYGQGLDRNGLSDGRWREFRVAKVGDDTLEVRPRRGSLSTAARGTLTTPRGMVHKRLPKASYWKVAGASDTPPKRRAVYFLDGAHEPGLPEMLALRMPANSKAIPMLDEVAANRHGPVARPNRGTQQSEEPPDQH